MSDDKFFRPCCGCLGKNSDNEYDLMNGIENKKGKPSLLLHSCCGPCSTAVIERLAPDYEITVFFYNPNITDEEEYEKRKENQKKFIESFNEDPGHDGKVAFMEGPYDRRNFLDICKGMENEPEGGRRCEKCFLMRLEKTAQTANMMNFDTFATTLSISPHKDKDTINYIGKRLASTYNTGFLDEDFKKKAGFQRSVELSKKYGLYRQRYCGCKFSNPAGK